MEAMQKISLILWGFLMGFVGWGCLFPLTVSVGKLLYPNQKSTCKALGSFLIFLSLLSIVLMLLAMMPIMLLTAGGGESAAREWKDFFGLAFFGSLAGYFVFGILRRLNKL